MKKDLTIITTGRAASTLVHKWLLETGKYTNWGSPSSASSWSHECGELAAPDKWNSDSIQKQWSKHRFEGPIIAKLPAFQYFLKEMFVLEPRVIALHRPPLDRVKSIVDRKWLGAVIKAHSLPYGSGMLRKASERWGQKTAGTDIEKLAMLFCYADCIMNESLAEYDPEKQLHLHFHDIISNKPKVMTELDEFCGLPPRKYWAEWGNMASRKQQSTGRGGFDGENFGPALDILTEQEESRANYIIRNYK